MELPSGIPKGEHIKLKWLRLAPALAVGRATLRLAKAWVLRKIRTAGNDPVECILSCDVYFLLYTLLFTMAKLQGFCCPVTNPSSSSSTVLRSILRKTGFAHTVPAALPCDRTGGSSPTEPHHVCAPFQCQCLGLFPSRGWWCFQHPLCSSGICLFVYSSSFNKRREQEASQSWCKESRSLL